MKTPMVIAAVLVSLVAGGGCVGKSKYMEAVAETEVLKAELEKTQALRTALEQQVKTLKDQNEKLTATTELASAESQRIKDSRDKERVSIDGEIKDLEHKVRELAAQQRKLRREYEDVTKQNLALRATVARYKKEFKDRQRAIEPASPADSSHPPVAAVIPSPQGSSSTGTTDTHTETQPTVVPVPAAPPQPGLALVNINTASANDMVLFLGLSKEVAERVAVNRPYRLKGELVAKDVLPKGTFDVIKDRITVSP
ncbi:MAG: hypothetical protein ACREJ4_06095 [Candidatus Methylomirabilaceae bacterium]